MKALWVTGVAVLGMATAAVAAGKPGTFSLSGLGAHGWAVDCTVTKPGGGASSSALRGKRGDKATIIQGGISSVACKTQAPPAGAVVFTLAKPFTCPYPKDERGACKWRMENGQTGDFTTAVAE